MQTDWYVTGKVGTYLILPTGMKLTGATLSQEARDLMAGTGGQPFCTDVDSREMAMSFNFVGVEDCLLRAGYSLLKS